MRTVSVHPPSAWCHYVVALRYRPLIPAVAVRMAKTAGRGGYVAPTHYLFQWEPGAVTARLNW